MKKYIEIGGKKCLKAETTDEYSIIYFLDDKGYTLGYKKHNRKDNTKVVRVNKYYALINKYDFVIWTDIGEDLDEKLENRSQDWFNDLRKEGIEPYELSYKPTIKSETLKKDGKFKIQESYVDLDDDNEGCMTKQDNFVEYSDETMSKVLTTQKNYSVFPFENYEMRFEELIKTDYVEGVTERIIEFYFIRLVEINGVSKTFDVEHWHSYDMTPEKQFIEEQKAKIKK